MSHLRRVLTLLLSTSTLLSGCILLGDEEPGEEQCATIFELCPEGSRRVESCAPGARCVLKNTCGGAQGTICQYDEEAQCLALPTCAEGLEQVAACADNGLRCEAESLCGTTIYCQEERPTTCAAYPSCPAGSVEVESCSDLYICSTATLCGQTIQCEHREPSCDAFPTCPQGLEQVPDCVDDGSRCEYVTTCGQTIACQEERAECLAIPTCPVGGQQVETCQPNAAVECRDVSLCGQTITCQFDIGCAPQDAHGVGDCAAFFGYAWDGASCVGLGGCACEGEDCEQTYQRLEDCEMIHSFCQP